jgi:hypothetical protein
LALISDPPFFPSDHDDHDHDHGAIGRTKYNAAVDDRSPVGKSPTSTPQSDALAIGLSVAVGICGLIFAAVLVFYIYLRRSHVRLRGSRGDIQELTTHAHMNGDVEGMANGFGHEDSANPIQVKKLFIVICSLFNTDKSDTKPKN